LKDWRELLGTKNVHELSFLRSAARASRELKRLARHGRNWMKPRIPHPGPTMPIKP
jgi:hypothetical protein